MCFRLTSAIKKTCLLVEIQPKATWLQQPPSVQAEVSLHERQFAPSLSCQSPAGRSALQEKVSQRRF